MNAEVTVGTCFAKDLHSVISRSVGGPLWREGALVVSARAIGAIGRPRRGAGFRGYSAGAAVVGDGISVARAAPQRPLGRIFLNYDNRYLIS